MITKFLPALLCFPFLAKLTCQRFMNSKLKKMSSLSESHILDRGSFKKTLNLVGIKVSAKLCNTISSKYRNYLFSRPRLKRIYDSEAEPDKKVILLSEQYTDLSLNEIPGELKSYLQEVGASALEYKLDLSYDHFTTDEVLTQLLPSGIEIPSSYEQIGHVAHLNLRDSLIPYKNLIGQVLLDKNSVLRTVINKVGNIETEFRTFPMEVIAGVSDLNVTVRESNAKFSFNFEEVYWNSRLQMEHSRLIELILSRKESKVIADMMAGVGPFSIPLAMSNKSKVYANDLNPASYKYLVSNSKLNKCEKNISCYCMDGREFILAMAKEDIKIDEVIMNLPASGKH